MNVRRWRSAYATPARLDQLGALRRRRVELDAVEALDQAEALEVHGQQQRVAGVDRTLDELRGRIPAGAADDERRAAGGQLADAHLAVPAGERLDPVAHG